MNRKRDVMTLRSVVKEKKIINVKVNCITVNWGEKSSIVPANLFIC